MFHWVGRSVYFGVEQPYIYSIHRKAEDKIFLLKSGDELNIFPGFESHLVWQMDIDQDIWKRLIIITKE